MSELESAKIQPLSEKVRAYLEHLREKNAIEQELNNTAIDNPKIPKMQAKHDIHERAAQKLARAGIVSVPPHDPKEPIIDYPNLSGDSVTRVESAVGNKTGGARKSEMLNQLIKSSIGRINKS